MDDPIATLEQRLPGRRVVVTGAASGLGLELCRRFAARGWTIGMIDREAESLARAERDIGQRGGVVRTASADVPTTRRSAPRSRHSSPRTAGSTCW